MTKKPTPPSPRIVVVEGLPEGTIFVLPGPRQVSRITDARTGKTYEVCESLEDYARRCMVIKNVTYPGPCPDSSQ